MYLYLDKDGNVIMSSQLKFSKGQEIIPGLFSEFNSIVETDDNLPEKFESTHKVNKGYLVNKKTKEKIKLK